MSEDRVAKRYQPHALDPDDPGHPEVDYNLQNRAMDEAFCHHMRSLIAHKKAHRYGTELLREPWE